MCKKFYTIINLYYLYYIIVKDKYGLLQFKNNKYLYL